MLRFTQTDTEPTELETENRDLRDQNRRLETENVLLRKQSHHQGKMIEWTRDKLKDRVTQLLRENAALWSSLEEAESPDEVGEEIRGLRDEVKHFRGVVAAYERMIGERLDANGLEDIEEIKAENVELTLENIELLDELRNLSPAYEPGGLGDEAEDDRSLELENAYLRASLSAVEQSRKEQGMIASANWEDDPNPGAGDKVTAHFPTSGKRRKFIVDRGGRDEVENPLELEADDLDYVDDGETRMAMFWRDGEVVGIIREPTTVISLELLEKPGEA